MNRIEQGLLVAAFLGLFVPLFMWYTKPDLEMQVRSLSAFAAPNNTESRVYEREPLAGLIAAGDEAVPKLVEVLTDGEQSVGARIGAAICLGRIDHPDGAAALAQVMGTGGGERLDSFLEHALVRSKSAPEAIGAVASDPAQAKRAALLLPLLGRLGKKVKPAKPVGVLVNVLRKSEDAALRKIAAVELSSFDTQLAVNEQAKAALDPDPAVCQAAYEELKQRENKDALRLAGKALLGKKDPKERQLGALLATVCGHGAGDMLGKAMRDQDIGVASQAARGYAPYLKALQPSDRKTFATRVRQLLEKAKEASHLQALGEAAGVAKAEELVPLFEQWLAAGPRARQLAAIVALGLMGGPMVGDQLVPHANAADPEVRKAIDLALRTLFFKGRKAWRPHHVGDSDVPDTPEGWKRWWRDQKKVHEIIANAKKTYEAARVYISKRTAKDIDKAMSMMDGALTELEKVQPLTGFEPDLMRRLGVLMTDASKMRPTGD